MTGYESGQDKENLDVCYLSGQGEPILRKVHLVLEKIIFKWSNIPFCETAHLTLP